MFVQTQNWRKLGVVLHKPSLKRKELRGIRDGLAELEVQAILSKTFCLILHAWWIVWWLCNVLVGDLECAFIMHEQSPPHLFLYLFFLNKRNKSEDRQELYQLNTLGSLNFIIIITTPFSTYCYYYYYYYYYYFILFYVFTQLFII